MINKHRGQIILITTFSLVIILGIIYISSTPILKFLRSIKETSYYYNALNIANTGLEISYLGIIPRGFDLLANTSSRIGSGCYITNRTACSYDRTNNNILNRTSKYCRLNNLENAYLNLKIATTNNITTISGSTFVKTKINSQGVFKNKLSNLKIFVWPVVCL